MPVIQILAVVGILQSIHTLNAEVFLALGRTGCSRLHAALGRRDARAVAVGVQGDIVTVAAWYAVATVLVEPVQAYLTTRVLGISLWRYVRSLSGVAQASALMAIPVIGGREALQAAGVPARARLVVLAAVGAAVYLGASLWRAPEVTREIAGVIARGNLGSAAWSLRRPGSSRSARPHRQTLIQRPLARRGRRSYDPPVLNEAHAPRNGPDSSRSLRVSSRCSR